MLRFWMRKVAAAAPSLLVHCRRHFERPVKARERDLLVVVEALAGQHADGVLIHRALDRVPRRGIDAGRKIGARQFGGKQRVQRLCR